MEGIQGASFKSQSSSNIEDVPSRPVSRSAGGIGQVKSPPTSSGVHRHHPSTKTRSWVEKSRSSLADSEAGFMRELTDLIRMFFDELLVAVRRRHGVDSVPEVSEVLEVRRRFILWENGEKELDQALARAHSVREPLVFNLVALAILLREGMGLYTPSMQNTLLEKTHRVLEQAAAFVRFAHPDRLEHSSPTDIVEFLIGRSKDIQSRVDNVYDQLPTIGRQFENYEGTKTEQAQDVGDGGRIPHNAEKLLAEWRALRRKLRQYVSKVMKSRNVLGDYYRAEDSHQSSSQPASFSVKESSTSPGSSNISSLLSDDGNGDDVRPLTDTNTSSSASQAQISHSDSLFPDSTKGPLGFECGKANRGRPARLDVFEKSQFIRIWPRPCQEPKYFHACFDTGACANFIRASVVADLDLPTTTCDTSYETGNGEVHVDRYVQPDWQLIQGQKRHQEYRFFLLRDMPHGIDLVVGTDFMNDTGITLRVNRTLLITFPSSRKDSNVQEQHQYTRQIHDDSIRQARRRTALNNDHAEAQPSPEHKKWQHQASPKELTNQKDSTHSKPEIKK